MVKKLFKHEAHALWRLMIPIWAVLLGVSVLGRLIQLLEQDTVVYDIVSGSAFFFYGVSLFACIICPFIFAVTRFYRNMFGGEGYLTFTLPVTTSQHLWVKLAVAVLTELITLAAAAISIIVVTFGELTVEIGKAIWYLFKLSVREWGAHMPLYLMEAVIGLIVAFTVETLLFYTCICIGQQFSKHRVLGAVGAYFVIYFIKQVIGTMSLIASIDIDWDAVAVWVIEHPFATIHTALCGFVTMELLVGVLFFFVSHHLMTKRLNLE